MSGSDAVDFFDVVFRRDDFLSTKSIYSLCSSRASYWVWGILKLGYRLPKKWFFATNLFADWGVFFDSVDGTFGITGFDGVFLTGRLLRHLQRAHSILQLLET